MKQNIYPPKLQSGDEIRVVAPSKSFRPSFTDTMREIAIKKLESLGLKVSFGKYVDEINEFESTTIEHRIEDLHDAFRDDKVKGILAVVGGASSNQLLRYLDYELIQNNPKILCGLSDITSLASAIYTKTGLITYSGPQFTVFGAEKQVDYTANYFEKCLFGNEGITLKPAEKFCDERFDSEEMDNEGYWIINDGRAEGIILGGNLITLNMLQGSEYMPDLSNSILFLEDNKKENIRAIENHLQSLILQPHFELVKGLVFGRFQAGTGMTKELLTKIVKTKRELNNIPVIANVDFGHTTPMITFPIGGECRLDTETQNIEIIKH